MQVRSEPIHNHPMRRRDLGSTRVALPTRADLKGASIPMGMGGPNHSRAAKCPRHDDGQEPPPALFGSPHSEAKKRAWYGVERRAKRANGQRRSSRSALVCCAGMPAKYHQAEAGIEALDEQRALHGGLPPRRHDRPAMRPCARSTSRTVLWAMSPLACP